MYKTKEIDSKLSIFCISDLHLEFYKSNKNLYKTIEKKLPLADLLILAGDIGYPDKHYRQHYVNLLKTFKTIYHHVIVVPRNHEYYATEKYNIQDQLDKLSDICRETNVILLNNNSVIINNVKIIGTTLWSQIDKYGFDGINDKGKVFKTIDDYNNEHIKCFDWLKNELDTDATNNEIKDQIIITHHLPSSKLVHARFKNSPINTAFCTDILDKLNLTKARYWFTGHTHEYSSMVHNNTKFVVNPLGYPFEHKETVVSYEVHHIK